MKSYRFEQSLPVAAQHNYISGQIGTRLKLLFTAYGMLVYIGVSQIKTSTRKHQKDTITLQAKIKQVKK